jgi:hypothetical protein
MDDAMVTQCGHSFGMNGLQRVKDEVFLLFLSLNTKLIENSFFSLKRKCFEA